MQIDDFLSNGMVRRWSLVDGQASCDEDAIDANAAGALAALQKNAAVRALIGPVETYEAAAALVARGEPDNGQPKQIPDPAAVRPDNAPDDWTAPMVANPDWALLPRTVETVGVDGQPQTAPEPRWQAYDAAGAIIAAASATTLALARWRQGEPSEADAEAHAAWATAKADAMAALATEAAKPLANDPRPVPNTVTLFQGRTVMRSITLPGGGTLFDAVDAYVEAHKTSNHSLYDAWNYSNGFERTGALVSQLAPIFGISSEQLDEMFRAGSAIKG